VKDMQFDLFCAECFVEQDPQVALIRRSTAEFVRTVLLVLIVIGAKPGALQAAQAQGDVAGLAALLAAIANPALAVGARIIFCGSSNWTSLALAIVVEISGAFVAAVIAGLLLAISAEKAFGPRRKIRQRLTILIAVVGGMLFVSQVFGQTSSVTEASGANDTSGPSDIGDLKKELQSALQHIDEMQNQLDAGKSHINLQQQIDGERERLLAIEHRLQAIDAVATKKQLPPVSQRGVETKANSDLAHNSTYENGFSFSTADKSFSLLLNGLVQIRYTDFNPQRSLAKFGTSIKPASNFDVYLGRFAVSGSAFSPTLKYFLQLQGSTAGNENNISLLDCFVTKTISKSLTVQAGRSWLPYTYEFYVNPGDLLFADLPVTEYAFGLSRTLGAQAYGQAGKWSYAGMIGNSVPALDVSGQQNFNSKVSYLGHFRYNILAPYGDIESDTSPEGADKLELTIWSSLAYNPVSAASDFQNVGVGDRTANATSSVGFRYRRFTLQGTGYYRKTQPASQRPAFNSAGYAEQSGLYVLPGRFEVAERVAGVNWGAANFTEPAVSVNTWFAGPNFPYRRIDEDTLGANWYFHGHNAKLQFAYSYLHGNNFDADRFGAGRVWVQTQVMF
jgi:hypothetical protein